MVRLHLEGSNYIGTLGCRALCQACATSLSPQPLPGVSRRAVKDRRPHTVAVSMSYDDCEEALADYRVPRVRTLPAGRDDTSRGRAVQLSVFTVLYVEFQHLVDSLGVTEKAAILGDTPSAAGTSHDEGTSRDEHVGVLRPRAYRAAGNVTPLVLKYLQTPNVMHVEFDRY